MDDFKIGFQEYLIDKKRNLPLKGDYLNFLDFVSNEVNKISGVGLYVYGSSQREDFVPGVSDIDGFFIFDDNFVIDKNKLMNLSDIYNRGLLASNVNLPLQFTVLDKGSLKDGRFVSYTKNYIDFFNSGNLHYFAGEELFDFDEGYMYKHPTVGSVSFNLGKVRQGFLGLESLVRKRDYSQVKKILNSPLKKLSQLPKQIIEILMEEVIEEKAKSLKKFEKLFSGYDLSIPERVNSILYNPKKHALFGVDYDKDLDFSLKVLGEVEKILRMYVEKFPKANENEVRD